MGLIEFQRAVFTMASTGLGDAGLSGRRSGEGRIILRAALGRRMTTTVGDIFW